MNKYILITLLPLLLLTACDDEAYFDGLLLNTTQPPPNFSSNEDLERILNGAYFALKEGPGIVGIIDAEPAHNVLVSDMVVLKDYAEIIPALNTREVFNRLSTEDELELIQAVWISGYTVIQQANTVINFYQNNEPFADRLAGQVDRMVGESLFLRAFAHFRLSRVFAPLYSSDPEAPGIILQTAPPIDAQDINGQSTVREVHEQIIADLERAIEILPAEYDPSIHDPEYQIRANKDFAKFLLARVYFLMGSEFWGSASDRYNAGNSTALGCINDLIEAGKYTPTNPVSETFDWFAGTQGEMPVLKSVETIWSHPFWRNWRQFRQWRVFVPQYEPDRNARFRAFAMNPELVTAIGWNDTITAAQDARYREWHITYDVITNPDPEYNEFYEVQSQVWCNKQDDRFSNTPIFRSPELYLTRAAILMQSGGDLSQVQADLTVTRDRAGLPPLTNTPTMTDVEHEWIKEYSFEGGRLLFLQALQMDIGSSNRSGGPIPYDDPSLYFAIPQREVDLNPNIIDTDDSD